MQASRPIYFSNCALYCVMAFQKKSAVSLADSHVSVGVKLPNGIYDRPAQVKNFYWLLPSEFGNGSIIVLRMRTLVEMKYRKESRKHKNC